jgi:hypothetical protein
MRVRYEDLVTNPDALISGVQRFLGVRTDLSVLSAAFDRAPARGPGDYKVEHTSAVHANSIGNGKRVPVDMLPPPLLQIINEKLQALGYEKLDRSWNAAERPVSLRFETVWSNRLRDLMTRAQRPSQGHDAGVFALVAEDHAALRWVVDTEDGAVYDGDGEVDAVLTGTAEDLVLMLTDAENFGVLLRSGRIRHIAPEPSEPTPTSELRRQIDAIVAAARSLVRDADAPDPAPAY